MYVIIPCGSCVIILTLFVTDETLAVWHTGVDLVNCWMTVVLTVLIAWVVENVVVMTVTGDEQLNASKISTQFKF